MHISILFGGEAGQGPNILTHILGEALVRQGFYVFYSRDYQSLIRGGHNFNVLTFSENFVKSNESKIDVLVALDKKTEEIHKKDLKKGGIILKGDHENMYFAGMLFKALGLDFKILEEELKRLEKRFDENIKEAKEGYSKTESKIKIPNPHNKSKNLFINGTRGISEGAIKSGLDVYYAYPMTPATTLLMELAQKQKEHNILVLEIENEIAVINAGIGSAITGAKTMVGTSGGGFDLMTEGLSLAGIAEIPLVIYLSQRPGPATGIPTYSAQGDLNLARHASHGEFQRVILAPGDPKESAELTSQAFYLSHKFKVPTIILSDKHLGESFYTSDEKINLIKSNKSTSLKRYNSYEVDPQTGCSTDDIGIINKNVEARLKKEKEIAKEAERFEQYKIYGDKSSKNIIVSWGSTKGAILDAINQLNVKFLHILHIEPFSSKIKKEIEGKNVILIENNATAQLGNLITEKTGIFIDEKNKILRYDGRPFLNDELREKIKERLK